MTIKNRSARWCCDVKWMPGVYGCAGALRMLVDSEVGKWVIFFPTPLMFNSKKWLLGLWWICREDRDF